MTFNDIPVVRVSQEEIESLAIRWWEFGAPKGGDSVDMLCLYAAAKVALVERSDREMGGDLARAAPSSNRVFVRAELLRAVEEGDIAASFELAHEFGHVVLHRGPEMKARKVEGNTELTFIPEEESAEDQAWRFARALTMPLAIVRDVESASALALRCRVPIEHAHLRMGEVKRLDRQRSEPSSLAEVLRSRTKSRSELAADKKAKEAREMLRVWNSAQRIPGDRANSRMCSRGKWRVLWSEYKQMTECGWTLQGGQIVAWMDLRRD